MSKVGVLGTTFATLALAVAPTAGQEKKDVEKPRPTLIEAQQDLQRKQIQWLMQRVEKLESDVNDLRRKVTLEDLQIATKKASESSLHIVFDKGKPGHDGGTGFFVNIAPHEAGPRYRHDRAYFLSAFHVTNDAVDWKRTKNGLTQNLSPKYLRWGLRFAPDPPESQSPEIPGNDVAFESRSEHDDLVLLSVPKRLAEDRGLHLRDLRESPLPSGPGHAVILAGFQKGDFVGQPVNITNTKGYDIHPIGGGKVTGPLLQFSDAWALEGNSGGHVSLAEIHLLDGRRTVHVSVIGVVLAKSINTGIGHAIPSDRARDFMTKAGYYNDTRPLPQIPVPSEKTKKR